MNTATLTIGFALLLSVLIPASVPAAPQSSRIIINGDGSTFAYPMYGRWIEEYEKENPSVHLSYVPNGSGAGIHDIMQGTVDFAGTDSTLNKSEMLDFSSHRDSEVLHFPTAIGADIPIYNIPGVIQEVRFTPQALAGIYLGTITKWNDPAITKPNPGIPLPATDIQVVHRDDGSGTTYVWTDYLTKVSPEWRQRVGTGISVNWPVGVSAASNEGVVRIVSRTPNSIGYCELTYAVTNRLFYGSVANRSGNFIKADLASITASAASVADKMPADFRVSITDAPGEEAYPISSFTWMIIPSAIGDSTKRIAIIKFLQWGLTKGQDYLGPLSYGRMPGEIVAREEQAIQNISISPDLAGSPNEASKQARASAKLKIIESLAKSGH